MASEKRYRALKEKAEKGQITSLQRQVKFVLIPAQREPDQIGPRGGKWHAEAHELLFYKYHGLKKKPEWAENVEARMKESEEKYESIKFI